MEIKKSKIKRRAMATKNFIIVNEWTRKTSEFFFTILTNLCPFSRYCISKFGKFIFEVHFNLIDFVFHDARSRVNIVKIFRVYQKFGALLFQGFRINYYSKVARWSYLNQLSNRNTVLTIEVRVTPLLTSFLYFG